MLWHQSPCLPSTLITSKWSSLTFPVHLHQVSTDSTLSVLPKRSKCSPTFSVAWKMRKALHGAWDMAECCSPRSPLTKIKGAVLKQLLVFSIRVRSHVYSLVIDESEALCWGTLYFLNWPGLKLFLNLMVSAGFKSMACKLWVRDYRENISGLSTE